MRKTEMNGKTSETLNMTHDALEKALTTSSTLSMRRKARIPNSQNYAAYARQNISQPKSERHKKPR